MEVAPTLVLLFCLLFIHKCYTAELDTISYSQFLTDKDTLVSATGIFELGFFQADSFENRYLGIVYKKIPVRTLVWVANRDQPLASASELVLKINDWGSLALYNNMTMIWSSNTTGEIRNASAKLRDTGNLVLMDQHEKVLWQSFDYPTEHWLPGMKIGNDYSRGIEWQLSSWKTGQHPVVGEFTWGIEKGKFTDDKLKQGSIVKFRSGIWRNQRVKGVSSFSRNVTIIHHVIVNEKEVSLAYSYNNTSILTRLTLSSSGKLESWAWVEGDKNWQLGVSFPKDVCDTYNICSAYGSCIVDVIDQSCACLDETRFVPRNKKGWEMADWSGGCVRRTPLDCKSGSETFIKYSNVKEPDTHSSWFNMSMSMQECEARCLQNCTCMAYANPGISLGERGCLLWFGELTDIRVYGEGKGGRDIFVRMASSELGNDS